MRIGCSTITFGPQSTEEALERIAELGFEVIDLSAVPTLFDHIRLTGPSNGEVERVATTVRRHGFEVSGVQTVPWAPDAIDDGAEIRRRCAIAADVAQAVNARVWVLDANKPMGPDARGRAEGLDRFKRTITMAAELAAERGLQLGVEAPHGGTLAESLPQVLELLDAADLPQLGVDFDTSHVLNCGSSTAEVLDAVGARVVHAALRDAQRGGAFCTPGDGDFDFAEFFSLLGATGYTGDATLELEPVHEHASASDRAEQADRARRYLEPLLTPVA